MKIWVDGQCFQTDSNIRGIGRYVADFLQELALRNVEMIVSLNASMKEETVAARIYLQKKVPNAKIVFWYGVTDNGELHTAYLPERMLDEKLLVSHINEIKPDIALSPSPFEGAMDISSPFIKVTELNECIKTACLFYDAIPHRYTEHYLPNENAKKLYNRRLAEIPNFDLVLCISEFTEYEYQDIFKKTNSVTISSGLSYDLQNIISQWVYDENSIGAKLGDYIAYVGGMDWRKNVPCLVKAIANLPECQSGELKLVLVGDFGGVCLQPLRDILTEYGIPGSCLVTTGYVSEKELVDIYKNAIVSVQPSRMEGFGLVALEAMACGTPFFSASGGAVGEVVGNDAQIFDPDEYASLTLKLQQLLSDEKFKKIIIKHGYQRVKKYSWKKTADLAMQSLKKLSKKRSKISKVHLKNEVESVCSQRLIMDVTSTALSPHLSGIQRVMHNLSASVVKQNKTEFNETVLSFNQNTKDWYRLENLDKSSVLLLPQNRIDYKNNDTHLLLDSSWVALEGQRQRITDVMAMGEEVVHGVYDLGPLTMSAMTSEGMPPAFRRWIEFILGYSTGIVCISKAVADEMYELIQDIKLPRPMNVGYFRLGADFSDVEADPTELGFTKTRPTFLMVGTIEPRKGQYYGLKAFEKLWAQGVDINLMIIGKAGWDTKVFQAVLDNHPEKNKRLFWRQGISDAGLAAAYQVADALIMTSYLEGFGLPVVEAGTKNTPVIMSDLPVFREVGEGTPKACYFIPGSIDDLAKTVGHFVDHDINVDYASVNVEWPTWDESALELKDVVLNNNWYKRYEPEQRLPNIRFNDIGDVTINQELSSDETQHELRVIEGPFMSDDGSQIRAVVAVKNLSDILWSSNNSEPGGINLSYHLYDRAGECICYDNPRTAIPFVLPPGKELFMPIRVSSDWLVKGAYTVGIELVQEGVRWFENEKKVNLLKPTVAQIIPPILSVAVDKDKSELVFLRGPFGDNISNEQYFIFAVINSSASELLYANENTKFVYSFIDKEGIKVDRGIWAVNHFDSLEANNLGYLALFADTNQVNKSASICIEYNGSEWLFDIASQELSIVQDVQDIQKTQEPSLIIDSNEQFNWLDNIDEKKALSHEVQATFDDESNVSLRGFNPVEGSHVWMSELSGEVDLSSLMEAETYASELKITCCPFVKDIEPIELSLYIGKYLVEKKTISHDFMEYSFHLSKSQFIQLCKKHFRITLVTNHSGVESNGGRLLSLCLAKLVLLLQKPKVKQRSQFFSRFKFKK
jgi:glycosyltransferase involved in cell wall biosynthesis